MLTIKPVCPDFSSDADWRIYTGQLLTPGDVVKVVTRKGVQIGIFERRLRTRMSIIIDGQPFRVPVACITQCRKGDPSNLPKAEAKSAVKCNPDGLADCKVGDLALMYRGGQSFDVVKLIEISPRLRCKVVGKDKIYGYKEKWFVQKLDKSWLSA